MSREVTAAEDLFTKQVDALSLSKIETGNLAERLPSEFNASAANEPTIRKKPEQEFKAQPVTNTQGGLSSMWYLLAGLEGQNTDFLNPPLNPKLDGLDPVENFNNTANPRHYTPLNNNASPLIQNSTHPEHGKLLDFIAGPESNGDYNIAYNSSHTEGVDRFDLTNMTVSQVRALQDDYVASGSASSAMGRYQIIRKTMDQLIVEMDLTGNELFDEEMQDRMGVALLEKRGLDSYMAGDISTDKFANNLSKEWASQPKDASNQSYYAGDGLNKAHVSYAQLTNAIQNIKPDVTATPTYASNEVDYNPMG